jgi:nucleoside diphosphate kinase
MFYKDESGMPMWREWRTNVSQRPLVIIVHGECAVEADRRNAGKKVST